MLVPPAWSSRVGRRLALAVLVAAAVPMVGSVWFITARAREQAESAAHANLRTSVKAVALNSFERLQMAEGLVRALHGADPSALAAETQTLRDFAAIDAVAVRPAGAALAVLAFGDAVPPAIPATIEPRLRTPDAALIIDDRRAAWLTVGGETGLVVLARLKYPVVFDYGDDSILRADYRLCVLDGGSVPLTCSDHDPSFTQLLDGVRLPPHGQAVASLGGRDYLASTWSLPMARHYGTRGLSLVVLAPRAEVIAPVRLLTRDVVLLSLASLLVIVLTVFGVVGRLLRPLAALGAAAAQIRRQDYHVALQVRTNDEFEVLADGFDSMLGAIRVHVDELEAFAVGSATALARTIDAKSPWTAGHSERVTALAVYIGRQLGLPAAEIDVLRRGGLLHDIGKLGTPVHILDKAGPPTPEERAEIERHPEIGVRILEPIAAFTPLLPIVLEHHEKFDGTGYPHRKRGTDIHPLARVLAVADVYDAMRSDRPYRRGIPRHVVIDCITRDAGSHFDPDVVTGFLAVMATGADAELYGQSPVLVDESHLPRSA